MNDYTFIDLDGVILDSEDKMLERKYNMGFHDHKNEAEFNDYFEYTKSHPQEWDYIIGEAKSINNSVEIIRNLELLQKKIAILTKIHTLYEMEIKVKNLREQRNIKCPIIFVPPGIKKYQIVRPNNQILIDDSRKNIDGWVDNGGTGILFDSSLSTNSHNKVKSLEFLLKR